MSLDPHSALLGIAGIVIVASITPGPNNFLVMQIALRWGIQAAVPAIAGIIVGGLCLLCIALCGLGALTTSTPQARRPIVVAGALYLIFLGLRMIASRAQAGESNPRLSRQGASLRLLESAAFQLLNPKSWILVLSAIGSALATRSKAQAFFEVSALLIIIPAVCLSIWCAMGVTLTRLLSSPQSRRWFDGLMGISLMLSALTLLRSA